MHVHKTRVSLKAMAQGVSGRKGLLGGQHGDNGCHVCRNLSRGANNLSVRQRQGH